LVLVVAGSQGQENSALTRIANGEHKDIKLDQGDVVVFSSDTIPGNEIAVNELHDTIAKKGARIAHSDVPGTFHVSGHGSTEEHKLLIALTKPRFLIPISGTYRDMIAYREAANQMGYKRKETFLIENGQEVILSKEAARFGKKLDIKNIYVDAVSGEEVENFVIRDRERLAKEGVVVILAEVKASDGQLATKPEVVLRGTSINDSNGVVTEIEKALSLKKEKVTNWVHIRKMISEVAGRHLFKKFRTRPLILPVVIEV
jgi:ribonuclease J